MTLLQTRPDTPLDSRLDTGSDAPASPTRVAGPVRLRFHDGSTARLPVQGTTIGGTPARRRLWSLSTSEAALDRALDRLIDHAARELRAAR